MLLNFVSLIKPVHLALEGSNTGLRFFCLVLSGWLTPFLPVERFLDQTFIGFIYLSFQIHVRLKFDKLAFHVLIQAVNKNARQAASSLPSSWLSPSWSGTESSAMSRDNTSIEFLLRAFLGAYQYHCHHSATLLAL